MPNHGTVNDSDDSHDDQEDSSRENEDDLTEIDMLLLEGGIQLGDGSPNTASKVSEVWSHFKKTDDPTKAKCNYCFKLLDRSGGATSNLRNHLSAKHRDIVGERFDKKTTPTKTKRVETPLARRKGRPPSKRRLTEKAARQQKIWEHYFVTWLCADYLSFCLGDSPYFRRFVNSLCPDFKVPSRTRVSERLVPDLHNKIQHETARQLDSAEHITLTMDGWSSVSNDHILAGTAHFITPDFEMKSLALGAMKVDDQTSDGVKNALMKFTDSFNITDKIQLVVTDNAEVMKKATRGAGFQWFGCIAHTLNLVVQDGLNAAGVPDIISKFRTLASHFHRSALAKSKLQKLQIEMKTATHRIIRDCVTRWNSTYRMLERFLEQKIPLSLYVMNLPAHRRYENVIMPTTNDLHEAEKIRDILKPYAIISTQMESERGVTASKLIYFANKLQEIAATHVRNLENSPQFPKAFALAKGLRNSMLKKERCISNWVTDKKFQIASILDPCQKMYAIPIAYRNDAKTCLKSEASLVYNEEEEEQREEEQRTWTESGDIMDEMQSFHAQSVGQQRKSLLQIEIDAYLTSPTVRDLKINRVKWWKENAAHYPRLAQVARKVLPMLANSAPCERFFSTMGNVWTKRCNSLHPKKATMLGIIASNLPRLPLIGLDDDDDEYADEFENDDDDDNALFDEIEDEDAEAAISDLFFVIFGFPYIN